MALIVRFMVCLVLVASVADAAITCDVVISKLTPCIAYLSNGGTVPPQCCSGVQALNGMAQTTPDRQQACQCIKAQAQGITGIKPDLAAALPRACGINLPYPISGSINCNSIN